MKRTVFVLVVLTAVLGAGRTVPGVGASSPDALSDAQVRSAAEQPGALVTDEELCAFRAPLALTGSGEVPAMCDEIVAWLKRLATEAPPCYALWIETGAIPACALPYR